MAHVALKVAVFDHDAAGIEMREAATGRIDDLLSVFRDE